MKLTPTNEAIALKNEDALYESVIDQAIQYAICAGVAPEHAHKMKAVLDGPRAPAKLISPVCELTSINEYVKQQGLRQENAVGWIQASRRSKNPNERFEVDETAKHHFFLLATERLGPCSVDGPSRFSSYSIVVLETKSAAPVCMACDLLYDGEVYSLVPSRIYRSEEFNAATRRVEPINRLANFDLPTNLLVFAVAAGLADGMPITEARKNRDSRQERVAAAQQSRYGRPVLNVAPPAAVPVGAGAAGNGFHDPFADQ